jgi:hypothetical protein
MKDHGAKNYERREKKITPRISQIPIKSKK